MSQELMSLIEKARTTHMTADDRAEQCKSFAYGNASLENPRITREMISEQFRMIGRITQSE